MKNNETLGERLKRLRENKGLSGDQLEELSKVNRSTIASLETGRNKSTSDANITALARHVGSTFKYLKYGVVESDYFTSKVRMLALRLEKLPEKQRKKWIDFINHGLDIGLF